MIIRKQYRYENAHIVRNCSSNRCKYSIHWHSYVVEVCFEWKTLDNGQMIYDFGLTKWTIKDFLDSFDHATTIWDRDNSDFIDSVKRHSARWISLPISSSAEQQARFFLKVIQEMLDHTEMANWEWKVNVSSVRVHETTTWYAEAFPHDVFGESGMKMWKIDLEAVEFSEDISKEWADSEMWNKLMNSIKTGEDFQVNQKVEQQVKNLSL